jgi:hypothetical protein
MGGTHDGEVRTRAESASFGGATSKNHDRGSGVSFSVRGRRTRDRANPMTSNISGYRVIVNHDLIFAP